MAQEAHDSKFRYINGETIRQKHKQRKAYETIWEEDLRTYPFDKIKETANIARKFERKDLSWDKKLVAKYF